MVENSTMVGYALCSYIDGDPFISRIDYTFTFCNYCGKKIFFCISVMGFKY